MKFLFSQGKTWTACNYYRHEIPAKIINASGAGQCEFFEHGDLPGNTFLERMKFLVNASGIFYYMTTSRELMRLVKRFKRFPIEAHPDGTYSYPPCVFEDVDDNYHFVLPTNPKFKDMGTRTQDGKLLTPGEDIFIIDENGNSQLLWKDGIDDFSIKQNLKKISVTDQCMKTVHGVSFSTPRIRDYFVKELNLKNTYVFPNSVIFDDYEKFNIQKKKGVVRILWQGGDSHYVDWYGIRQGLAEASKKFPEIRWVIWGGKFPWIHKVIPESQIEYHSWVPYEAYRIKLSALNFDFAIAPLAENMFNVMKSAIKFYEPAALPDPKPVLAANVPPYGDEIVHGETGLLYHDFPSFMEGIERLVRDAKERRQLGENAKQWVRENRYAFDTVPPYVEWITQTIGRFQERKRKSHLRKVQKELRDSR